MSRQINMLAPAGNMNFACRSGNQYTSNSVGVVYNVNSADVNDMEANNCINLSLLGAGIMLPWVHGQFYTGSIGVTPAALLTVASTLYATPIFIPNQVSLGSISYSVTTGQTGGKVRGALFYDNQAGYPGAIVAGTDTGDLTATGTAVETGTLSPAVVLQPGWYWLGTIAAASSTMPSVAAVSTSYSNELPSLLGFDTAAHALATSGQAPTGLSIGTQTYPATNMATSFPTFPTGAALVLNADVPMAAFGV